MIKWSEDHWNDYLETQSKGIPGATHAKGIPGLHQGILIVVLILKRSENCHFVIRRLKQELQAFPLFSESDICLDACLKAFHPWTGPCSGTWVPFLLYKSSHGEKCTESNQFCCQHIPDYSQGKERMWDINGHLHSVQLQSERAQRKRFDAFGYSFWRYIKPM